MLQPRLYWRAIRRMDRRHAAIRAAVRAHPELAPDLFTATHEYQLFCEAVRLVNRMATLQLAIA